MIFFMPRNRWRIFNPHDPNERDIADFDEPYNVCLKGTRWRNDYYPSNGMYTAAEEHERPRVYDITPRS